MNFFKLLIEYFLYVDISMSRNMNKSNKELFITA